MVFGCRVWIALACRLIGWLLHASGVFSPEDLFAFSRLHVCMRCRGYVGFVAPPCDSSCEHGENNGRETVETVRENGREIEGT